MADGVFAYLNDVRSAVNRRLASRFANNCLASCVFSFMSQLVAERTVRSRKFR